MSAYIGNAGMSEPEKRILAMNQAFRRADFALHMGDVDLARKENDAAQDIKDSLLSDEIALEWNASGVFHLKGAPAQPTNLALKRRTT